MSDKDKKPSIFSKILEVSTAVLDAQIHKAKTSIVMNQQGLEDEFYYSKAVTEDPTYAINAAGWKEKPYRLQDGHLKQMSLNDSVIAAVIQTRQNQVSNHSKPVTSEKERGWMICLRDEKDELDKIKTELQSVLDDADPEKDVSAEQPFDESTEDQTKRSEIEQDKDSKEDDEVEEYNWELERKAKEKLELKYAKDKKKVKDFLLNCGLTENRSFESKSWNFDKALRAWVRDTLTYDRYATEIVPDRAGRVHHWFPVDAGTIKFSSNRLKDYKQVAENFLNLDLLYPERKVEAMEKQKVLELNEDLLQKDAYKYVQVIRGKIERAYTEDEMKLGIRNVTTDIYNNGYGISELELVVGLVTGHLNAEFYNQAYFTQGFSAKGILHIKAALNRRKTETIRQQWQHMLRGSRNSFQTPIFAGIEGIEWIPLTQNHDDIGFEGWMRYLIKMICAVYQIDPYEIGVGFRDEGGRGSSGLGGDNTQQKMEQSKDKGLYPLILHIENYVNEQILKPFDSRFVMKFTGVSNETRKEALDRQKEEVKFKKTVNEVRAEDGLPPLPGMDDVILDPNYMSWYNTFSKRATEKSEEEMESQLQMMGGLDGSGSNQDPSFEEDPSNLGLSQPPMAKSRLIRRPKQVKVEYYRIKE